MYHGDTTNRTIYHICESGTYFPGIGIALQERWHWTATHRLIFTWQVNPLIHVIGMYLEEPRLTTAKLFMTDRSQAVRLPKEFRFEGSEVETFRRGDEVVLRSRPQSGAAVFGRLSKLPDDFMEERRQDKPAQERDSF